jgi:hypothetical protein
VPGSALVPLLVVGAVLLLLPRLLPPPLVDAPLLPVLLPVLLLPVDEVPAPVGLLDEVDEVDGVLP